MLSGRVPERFTSIVRIKSLDYNRLSTFHIYGSMKYLLFEEMAGIERKIPHALPCAKSSFKPFLKGGCPHRRLSLPDESGLTSPTEFWASGLKVLA
jgi:hypothetical protein